MTDSPTVIVIGGPNGAGKSTIAPALLNDYLGVDTFVNADTIARGLSAFDSNRVSFEAGRIMLREIRHLADARENFAFETTLASRTFAPWLRRLRAQAGYSVILIYLWVQSPDLAVRRVRQRVLSGGHDVPEPDIRRRWSRSIRNLFDLYLPLAHEWSIYNNSGDSGPSLVANGGQDREPMTHDATAWSELQRSRQ